MVATCVPGPNGPIVLATGPSYSAGPGDIVTGALAWWGCRGYNSAYATGSNPAMDVVDAATGLTQTTINIKADGSLDNATILALGYAVVVKKLYDQTGNGNHLTQATLANMPALTQSAVGALPAMTFSSHRLTRASISQAQPYSISAVTKRTTASAWNAILVVDNDLAGLFFKPSGGEIALNAQSVLTKSGVTENTWHALNAVANGASSTIDADGSSTTGNAGAIAIAGAHTMTLGSDTSNESLIGLIAEAGLWPSGFSGANITSMSANQHAYWGF